MAAPGVISGSSEPAPDAGAIGSIFGVNGKSRVLPVLGPAAAAGRAKVVPMASTPINRVRESAVSDLICNLVALIKSSWIGILTTPGTSVFRIWVCIILSGFARLFITSSKSFTFDF